MAFVFFGADGLGKFQQREVDSILALDCPLVPVILPGGHLPDMPLILANKRVDLQSVANVENNGGNYEDYCDEWLRKVFEANFPDRFIG